MMMISGWFGWEIAVAAPPAAAAVVAAVVVLAHQPSSSLPPLSSSLPPRCPGVFDDEYRQLYVKYNEPSFVKYEKIDLLALVANETSVQDIVTELSEYASGEEEEEEEEAGGSVMVVVVVVAVVVVVVVVVVIWDSPDRVY